MVHHGELDKQRIWLKAYAWENENRLITSPRQTAEINVEVPKQARTACLLFREKASIHFTRRRTIDTPFEIPEATDRPFEQPTGIYQRTQIDDSYKYPAARVPITTAILFFLIPHG